MHPIKEHKTVEDFLQAVVSWEDQDTLVIIGVTEDHEFEAMQYWQTKPATAGTLLEALYTMYGRDCYCDEVE